MPEGGETGMRKESLDSDFRDVAVAKLRQWDPDWADAYLKVASDPCTSGVLPRKTVELVRIALNAAWTNFNPSATRVHMRAALEAGATREQVLLVLKMAAVMSIDACSLVIPILLEEATESELDAVAAGRSRRLKAAEGTPNIRQGESRRQVEHSVGPVL
jgi:alkylhydroperoxidase/carboxymuconolactone decarboxylase family protein YurZ